MSGYQHTKENSCHVFLNQRMILTVYIYFFSHINKIEEISNLRVMSFKSFTSSETAGMKMTLNKAVITGGLTETEITCEILLNISK